METRLYKRNDFPRGGNGGGEAKGREGETIIRKLETMIFAYSGTADLGVFGPASCGPLLFPRSWKTKLDPRTAVVDGWMDIHNESCRLEWRTRGTGQAVEISLGRVFSVYNSFFTKKNPFPESLWTFVSRKRERERKRIRLRFHVQPWNNPRSRHTLIYIYIHVYIYYIYIYMFPSLFVAVPRRKENYLGIGTFKTFRTFSYNFVNAVYG